MRVSERSIYENANASIQAAREREERASQVAASGVAVSTPWDSPTAGQIARERYSNVQAKGFATTAARALDETDAVDGALGAVGDTLSRAAELAVQMANGNFNASDRAAVAGQAQRMLSEIVSSLNVEVGGRYLLGGTSDTAPPFDATGAYSGDTGVRTLELAPGVVQAISVRADNVIKGAAGGVDVLAALTAFGTALQNNDVPGIQASITAFQTGISQVAAARTDVGGIELGLQSASDAAKTLSDAAETRRSGLADADIAEAATNLALADRTLQAAISAGAKSFSLSILDKL